MNIALTIAYDGTSYMGWQKTPTGPSIEEILQNTLRKILQHDIKLQAASRTDRGVHAKGQIVNFFTSKFDSLTNASSLQIALDNLQNSINDLLPKDICVTKISSKEPSFHPTLDCKKKEYRYYLSNLPYHYPWLRHISWHCYKPLNMIAMKAAILLLIGSKDFSAFCNVKKNEIYDNKVRNLTEIILNEKNEGQIEIIVKGNNFLYKMVRNIVGTLVYIGLGKLTLEQLHLALEKKDRRLIGMTAPAHGLFLYRVYYE
jgi:tRNA pseudouridine38-40 synthase